MKLSIPNTFNDGARHLWKMEPHALTQFVEAAVSASPSAIGSQLAAQIADESGASLATSQEILGIFIGLTVQRVRATTSDRSDDAGFAASAYEAIELVAKTEEGTNESATEPLAGRDALLAALQSILASGSPVTISAKAADMHYAESKLFQGCRIISDFRPMFDESEECIIQAGIIQHSLRIEYFDTTESQVKSIEVSVDTDDLNSLVDGVRRALSKDAALSDFASNANINLLSMVSSADDD